jgi:SAM-dependent methyltransferase
MPHLPDFDDNPSNVKEQPLTGERVKGYACQPVILRLLEAASARLGKPVNALRILDYGCGQGVKVAWLRSRGYDCYGVDVEPSYIEGPRGYFAGIPSPFPITSVLAPEGRSIFPDCFFDVVLSHQVLEHVENIDTALAELRRVMHGDAVSLHAFPSAYALMEPHMQLPFVHWLPKNRARHILIRLLLACGLGKKYFPELSVKNRACVFFRFSAHGTFYRTPQALRAAFNRHGFKVRDAHRQKLLRRGGKTAALLSLPVAGKIIGWAYRAFYQTYLLAAPTPSALEYIGE